MQASRGRRRGVGFSIKNENKEEQLKGGRMGRSEDVGEDEGERERVHGEGCNLEEGKI
jgi:hypothetical protein